MNREFLHKITLLGCLLLLITSSVGSDKGFQTPEQYAQIVQEHFANEEWDAGKALLDEGLQKYPGVSDLPAPQASPIWVYFQKFVNVTDSAGIVLSNIFYIHQQMLGIDIVVIILNCLDKMIA